MDHCAKGRSHEQILTLSDTCSPGYLESISLMPLYTDHSYFSDVRRKYFPGFPKKHFPKLTEEDILSTNKVLCPSGQN